MPEAESSKPEPQSSGPQAKDMAAVALVLSAGAAEISAEAEERDRARLDPPRIQWSRGVGQLPPWPSCVDRANRFASPVPSRRSQRASVS